MATISFYLPDSKKDKKGRVQIMLQCVHAGKRFRYYTGEKIDPKYWSNSKRNLIKPSYEDSVKLNNYLLSLENKIHSIVLDYKNSDRYLSVEMLKLKFLEDSTQSQEESFLGLFDKYIQSCSVTRTTGTIKNYKNSLHYLKEFQKDKKFDYQFDLINMAFYDQFVEYLISKKSLSNNTVGRIIKVLKTFLNWATENGHNSNLEYKKFKMFQEAIEVIYLTDKELNALYNLPISNKASDKARDLFCFGCFTGLRFSDVATLNRANIKDDEITIRTQKTKDILVIPLLPQAKAILEKYDYVIPVSCFVRKTPKIKMCLLFQ